MLIFCKKKKKVDISKIKRALVLKVIFFETKYVYVLTYQISGFCHNSNEFKTGGNFTPPHLHLEMNP